MSRTWAWRVLATLMISRRGGHAIGRGRFTVRVLVLLAIGSPGHAMAASCDATGGLTFVGTTSDSSQTVWLSATSAGAFELQAAQQGQVVDDWTKDRRGLHISLSPDVSNGNGGTHKLFETGSGKDCLLDTQNQKGGIVIPPNITLPSLQFPGHGLPPIGKLFPDFQRPTPPTGVTPTVPPGVTPPVATLPPSGVMPTLPPGVTPPVAVLPPSGVMPTVPPGVTPPIGVVPPTGVMPTLPPGVTPPVAVLPPSGVMPTLPPGVTPPIGVVPPIGVMPTLPPGVTPPVAVLPPSGVMPTLPPGVRPPIGVVPPTGVMPTLPPGVTPPVAVLPPSGVMPTLPPGITPPDGPLPPGGLPSNRAGTVAQIEAAKAGPPSNCATPYRGDDGKIYDSQTGLVCGEAPAVPGTPAGEVALTAGRQLVTPTTWNIWSDAVYTSSSDHRYGLDTGITSKSLTGGLDRSLTDDLVAGVSLSLLRSNSAGFGDMLTTDTTGFTIGPYAALRLSPRWAISAALSYGEMRTDLGLAVLDGMYTSPQYSVSGGAYAQYSLGEYQLRPQLEIFYDRTNNPAYTVAGFLLGRGILVPLPASNFDYANTQLSAEINRTFATAQGNFVMPYGEFGTQFEFARPGGGAILTGTLTQAIPSPWSFWLRAGVRGSLWNQVVIQGQAGYLSLGQGGLSTWEGEFRLSLAI